MSKHEMLENENVVFPFLGAHLCIFLGIKHHQPPTTITFSFNLSASSSFSWFFQFSNFSTLRSSAEVLFYDLICGTEGLLFNLSFGLLIGAHCGHGGPLSFLMGTRSVLCSARQVFCKNSFSQLAM